MKRYTFALFINNIRLCSVAKILRNAGFYTSVGIYVIHLLICCRLTSFFHRIAGLLGSFTSILVIFTLVSLVTIMFSVTINCFKLTRFAIGK